MPKRLLHACLASLLLGMAAGLWIVPDRSVAQTEALFFAATGHRLTNEYGFLNHWRSSEGAFTLGAPITEALLEGGRTVQYFERGRLELHPEYGGAILRGRLGVEYAEALWRSFAPPAAGVEQAGARLFAETGHSVADPFLGFWEARGGVEVFGLPVSAPAWEYVGARVALVQYFERVRLEHYPDLDPASALQIGTLGRDLALLRGLPTAPVSPAGALVVDTAGQPLPEPAAILPAIAPPPTGAPAAAPPAAAPAATSAPAPKPTARPAAPAAAPAPTGGGKSIVVDLSEQWLYALSGDTIVFDAPVSTGRDGFNTPVGRYAIYHKVRSQTMRGCAGGECWNVPDVPHAMYIVGGVALHGTYWHNQFGSGVRRSHGCVNLPLDSAAWLYGWAPVGTPVIVRW
jgi:L,D-transpeptidase catalytic domain